jgi:catechol 2,3-dioxygenase-like lactoylglutathione lyase family enzyme
MFSMRLSCFGIEEGVNMKKIKFAHTNIIAVDWRKISRFYIEVFGCVPIGPARKLSGLNISEGTGVEAPSIEGLHLRLPGCGEEGPTLEVFQYKKSLAMPETYGNSRGLSHIAFEVDNVEEVCVKVVRAGGWMLGKLVRQEIEGVGLCTFIYVRDPERNIVEIQKWERS